MNLGWLALTSTSFGKKVAMLTSAIFQLFLGIIMTTTPGAHAQQAQDEVYREAFLAFFPLYEMARLRYQAIETPNPAVSRKINEFSHSRRLLDHRARQVTAPNNDTLNSSAWLDLSQGPVVLEVPAMGERYYSFHFMNAYTDNTAIVGLRNAGGGAYRVAIVGPGWNGPVPQHAHRVNADTNDFWLLGRILANDEEDAKLVAQLQDQTYLRPPANAKPGVIQVNAPSLSPSPEEFLKVINEMLQRNPPVGAAQPRAARARAVGIGLPSVSAQGSGIEASLLEGWAGRFPALRVQLANPAAIFRARIGSWFYPPPDVGQWGDRLLLRATVALRGIGALDAVEAMYFNGITDQQGSALDGKKRYRMRVPAGGIPVKAFWSVTMYEATPEGRFFFTLNPINRFSIGNRTKGLQMNADGSLDVYLQATQPLDAKQLANWLPTPPGPFRMSLRAYLPTEELVQGRAQLPIVEEVKD